ncbi:MAG: 50S ribosomal protein L1 [candidate division WS6 bacterium GW2011_GWF2_39_15]|uniref:Ribosomal protein n=1 Tax=candidate division WS6 bacterium GW2011_GWF2_39_15 TaxID=1619100 RepID=A0A0G0N0L7_9BACT|nr:MAG: 50S ribosomal protein L1 [candidate division WS6 bacterium GW2011_GWF2_39_15]
MARRGKKYVNTAKKIETKEYTLEQALKVVKTASYSKFGGSVELHVAISLPKDKDAKSIKGAVSLPHSTAKNVIVAVFATPENAKAALAAGADKAGLEDLVKEVQSGKITFDVAIATPDVMAKIAVLGKELGPKGLMPNPKTGTVTADVAKTVKEYKQGKMTFKADEQGGIHIAVGKLDLDDAKIVENIKVAVTAIEEAIGKSFSTVTRRTYLAPTMGKAVKFKYE